MFPDRSETNQSVLCNLSVLRINYLGHTGSYVQWANLILAYLCSLKKNLTFLLNLVILHFEVTLVTQ